MVIVNYQEKVDRCMDGWHDGQMDDQFKKPEKAVRTRGFVPTEKFGNK